MFEEVVGVVLLLENSDKQIAMQLQDDNLGVSFANYWGLFGGWIEENETSSEAAI